MGDIGMTDRQHDWRAKPLPLDTTGWLRIEDAQNKALTAFFRGVAIGALVIGLAACAIMTLPASAGEVSISGSVVTLQPSTDAGALAVVTFDNRPSNGVTDDGVYSLSIPGLTVDILFAWEVSPLGDDRITVIPPPGVTCIPASCHGTALEGYVATVLLNEWAGM